MTERTAQGPDGQEFKPAFDPAILETAEEPADPPGPRQTIQMINELQQSRPDVGRLLQSILKPESFNKLISSPDLGGSEESFEQLMLQTVTAEHPDRAEEVRQAMEAYSYSVGLERKLEHTGREAGMAQFERLLGALPAAVDWDAALASEPMSDDATLTAHITAIYRNGWSPTGYGLDELADELDKLQSLADRFPMPELDSPVEREPQLDPEAWLQSTRRAMLMLETGKPKDPDAEPTRKKRITAELAKINWTADMLNDSKPGTLPWPAQIKASYQAKFEAGAAQFDAQDEAEVEAAADANHINSRTPLMSGIPGLRKVLGPEEDPVNWVTDKLKKVPPAWAEGLGFLYFRDDLKDVELGRRTVDGVEVPGKKIGTFQLKGETLPYGGATVLEENFVGIAHRDEETEADVKKRLAKLIYHELAHEGHYSFLSIAELRQWIELVDSDPVGLTEYIQDNRDDPTKKDSGAIYQEDFADTFSLFMVDPGIVATKSGGRFQFFNDRMQRYPLEVALRRFTGARLYSRTTITNSLLDLAHDPEFKLKLDEPAPDPTPKPDPWASEGDQDIFL